MRYLIKFSYNGSKFNGYQRHPGYRTVQAELERVLTTINEGTFTRIVASGRTDKGVHALSQIAHFDLQKKLSPETIQEKMNNILPDDIYVYDVEVISSSFHARFHTKKKTYKYLINLDKYDPIHRSIIYQYNESLDIDLMNKAIQHFIGKHDFKLFVDKTVKTSNYTRIIYDVSIIESNNMITISFSGSGFMKHQVRLMVGTLIRVGNHELPPIAIKDLLNRKMSRSEVRLAPSEGLYLVEVDSKVNKKECINMLKRGESNEKLSRGNRSSVSQFM